MLPILTMPEIQMYSRLEIKTSYIFKVVKHLQISECEGYFVLLDVFGCKHLLTDKYYRNYNLQVGSNILCLVDKINCKGKIFIEPPHPLYKIGDFAEFKFIRFETLVSKKKKSSAVSILADALGNTAILREQPDSIPEIQLYKIIGIKKAVIFVEIATQ